MPRELTQAEKQQNAERELNQKLMQIFVQVMHLHPVEGFSADTIVEACENSEFTFPKEFLAKRVPAAFLIFKGTGYIRKLPTYILSRRNKSAVLPLWVTCFKKGLPSAYGAKNRKVSA